MLGLLLDQVGSVYRLIRGTQGNTLASLAAEMTQVYASVPCQIVPISSFDRVESYSFNSTHLLYVPLWISLQKEDEMRLGRRTLAETPSVVARAYAVNGERTFRLGGQQHSYYCNQKS